MQLDIVKATVQAATKGANIILQWHRACKVRKTCSDTISKAVRAIGRVGINYDNMAAVKEKRENGELPAESAGLPWGVWAIFPYLIEHKGKYYLRLYKGTSATTKPFAQYYRNGIAVSFDDVKDDLLASEKGEKIGDCFTCKVEDMTAINWEPVYPSVNIESSKENKTAEVMPIEA